MFYQQENGKWGKYNHNSRIPFLKQTTLEYKSLQYNTIYPSEYEFEEHFITLHA